MSFDRHDLCPAVVFPLCSNSPSSSGRISKTPLLASRGPHHGDRDRVVRNRVFVRTLRSSADGASVAAESNGLLLLLDVLKELHGALKLPAIDLLGGLAGVLE